MCYRHATTISILFEDILLEIFDFCRQNYNSGSVYEVIPEAIWDWSILVHVCQRWRKIVFDSPLRLNLRILCTYRTAVRKHVDVWPTFPIHIEYLYSIDGIDDDNIVAALGHINRVCAVGLRLTSAQLRKFLTAMQEPFPELTHLILWMHFRANDVPVLPSEFLGRSAPHLQKIELDGIPFPALPTLLLSTSDLVTLHLLNIPQTGYISPDRMVAALDLLTSLRDLYIGFQSPVSRPDQISLPPVTRAILPALTYFKFWGAREYLEDLMAQINVPHLHSIFIYYFNQLVEFEIPQLWRCINGSEDFNPPMRCFLEFESSYASFSACSTTQIPESKPFDPFPPSRRIGVHILCEGIDWQVSHISQALNQISAVFANTVHFYINGDSIKHKPEDMDGIEWLQLLHPFSSVQTLFLSRKVAGPISHALEDIAGAMATDVLPVLDTLCIQEQPVSSVHKFITARSESGRPVTIVDSRKECEERLVYGN
ncbi:hypothetical protein V8E53_005856 [Lactarius tabidus]